jgi:hypothetical protein
MLESLVFGGWSDEAYPKPGPHVTYSDQFLDEGALDSFYLFGVARESSFETYPKLALTAAYSGQSVD